MHEEARLRNKACGDRTSTPRDSGEAHNRPAASCEGTGLLKPAGAWPRPSRPAQQPSPRPALAVPPRYRRPAPRFLPGTPSVSLVADPSHRTSLAPPSDGGRAGAGSTWQREGLGGRREATFPSLALRRPKREEEAAAKSVGGMAEAPDEHEPGSVAGEQQQHVGCQVFSERLAQGKPQQGFLSSFFTNNQKCQLMLLKTLATSRSLDPGAGRLRVGSETGLAGRGPRTPPLGGSGFGSGGGRVLAPRAE